MQNAYEHDMPDRLIAAWHDAVNHRDLAAARALVTDPVQVSGPRGTDRISAGAFADWILRSGIRLRPVSTHRVDGATVVIEQEATWPGDDAPTLVATLFQARDGALTTISRFDSLEEALHAEPPRH